MPQGALGWPRLLNRSKQNWGLLRRGRQICYWAKWASCQAQTSFNVSLRQSMASRDWTWCYPWSLTRLINSISRESTRNLPFPPQFPHPFLVLCQLSPSWRYVPTLIPSWIWSTRPTVFISSSCTWPKMALGWIWMNHIFRKERTVTPKRDLFATFCSCVQCSTCMNI